MVHVAAVLLLVLMSASAGTLAVARSGRTTFYGGAPDGMSPYNPSYGTSVGSCGYGLLDKGEWPYWSVGALAVANSAFGGPTFGCGSCWRITCQGRGCTSTPSTVITITDSCPECKYKNNAEFDIQALVFAKIASPSVGSIDIDYEQVSCNPGGNMIANVLDNRGAGAWARFGVSNVAGVGQVASISVNGVRAEHTWGSIFEINRMPSGPYTLHVSLADGSSVTCANAFGEGESGQIRMNCQAGGGGGGGGGGEGRGGILMGGDGGAGGGRRAVPVSQPPFRSRS